MWRLTWRGVAAGLALGLVLGALQALRLGDALVALGEAGAWGLLGRLGLGVSGLMSAALPAGALVSGLVTYRERGLRGEWLALRTLGVRRRRVIGEALGAGLAASALAALFALWLGPLGLASLGAAVEEAWVVERIASGRGAPVWLGEGVWAGAAQARSGTLEDVWGVDTARGWGFRAEAASPSADGRWRLQGAEVQGPGWRIAAAAAEVRLGGEEAGWSRLIPPVERQSGLALWTAAQAGDRLAWRALAKRAALILAPPLLLLAALGAAIPATPGVQPPGAGRLGLLGVGLGAGFFALLRAGEVWGGAAWWWAALAPLGGLALAALGLGWRLWLRW